MSKSSLVASYPPTWISLMTYRAPSSTGRRSAEAVTVAPDLLCAELLVAAQVGHDVAGELHAARTDEGDLDHHGSVAFRTASSKSAQEALRKSPGRVDTSPKAGAMMSETSALRASVVGYGRGARAESRTV